MTKICLVDYGDAELHNEILSILEAVFDEGSFPTDNIDYVHATRQAQLDELANKYDLIISFGAEAMHLLCLSDKPLKDFAGCMTYNPNLKTWILPSYHPNCIYMPEGRGYSQFDIIYAHIHRAIDMFKGTLPWPEINPEPLDWTFYGHNGKGWDPDKGYNPRVWSGYDEATPEELVGARETLLDWLAALDATQDSILFAADTESYTVDHLKPLTMAQIFDGERAYAFNWGIIQPMVDLWQEFFNHPHARFVWHNVKFDAKMIKHWLKVDVDERHDDTMAWALGLTEKSNQTGLKFLARQYAAAPFWSEGLERWLSSDKDKINYGHIRPDILAEYGCMDVFYTYQLAKILPPLVSREGTEDLVRNILLPAQRTFAELEYEGIRVDQEYAQQLQAQWEPIIEAAIKEVQEYARSHGFPKDPGVVKGQVVRDICKCVPRHLRGKLDGVRCTSYGKLLRETHKFNARCETCANKRYLRSIDPTINVRSNNQMQHFCFDVLEMEQTWEGRKTNKYFWEINQSHEFAKLVAKYRELDYLNRNIIQGFSRFIREDGRIHPDFYIGGTVSGRLAVKNPAMQTVPSQSKTGKLVKKLFRPDWGCLCVDVDYSNLELYMAHHLTKDEALLEALEKDMHRTTAAAMFMKAYEEVTAEERQSAKPVNFGAGYNIKAKKLSRDKNLVGITGGEASKAQVFLDAFWGKYRVWNKYRKGWIKEALANCYMTTELGRKRRWSLITRDNVWKVENQSTNFLGQSLSSDLCLTSLIRLQKELTELGWGRVMLSVHDSILFSIKKEHIHEAVELIRQVMTTPVFETTTPFKVDVKCGLTYGSVEPYDPNTKYEVFV